MLLCIGVCVLAPIHAADVSTPERAERTPAVRVALVSSCGGNVAENELALATVALSKGSEFILVERTEIERILQEQQLRRCGEASPAQALAVGRLLHADVFAAVENYGPTTEVLNCVVFDAASGVRLADVVLPRSSMEQTAEGIAAAVRNACAKRSRFGSQLRPVCLVATRNAGLPREMNSSCEAVGRLLEQRLINSTTIAILERERLDQINRERELPGDFKFGALKNALVLLELEIAPAGSGALQGTVFVSDSSGKILDKIQETLATSVPGDLAEALLPQLLRALSAAPPGSPFDAHAEALRFLGESEFLWNDGNHLGALCHAEAALALDTTSVDARLQLAKCLADQATQLQHAGESKASLSFASRGLEICRQVRLDAKGGRRIVPELQVIENMLSTRSSVNRGTGYWDECQRVFAAQDLETRDRMLAFQRQLREVLTHMDGLYWRSTITNRATMLRYASEIDDTLANAEKFASSSEAWTSDVIEIMSAWLEVFNQYRLAWGGWDMQFTQPLARLSCQVNGCAQKIQRVPDWQLEPNDLQRFAHLFETMKAHSDPIIQSYGRIGALALALRGRTGLDPATSKEYESAKTFIREMIDALRFDGPKNYNLLAYAAARDLVDIVPDPEFRRREHLDLFEFMMERRDVSYWTVYMVVDPTACRFAQYHFPVSFPFDPINYEQGVRWQLANADRVSELFASTNRQDVDATTWSFETGSFERQLGTMRQRLEDKLPSVTTNSVASAPWTKAETLFSMAGQPWNGRIRSVVLGGNVAFALATTSDSRNQQARCVRVPLDGTPASTIGTIPLTFTSPLDVIHMIVEGGFLYVGDRNRGIQAIPVDGGPVRAIDHNSGLLSSHVRSFTVVENEIYAMLDEGYLVAYDLGSRRCEILASKRSREKRSPLDDIASGFEILAMVADSARHRVLFTTRFNEKKNCFPQIGLWQLDTRTHEMKQLLELYYPATWMTINDPDHLLLECPRNETDAACQPPFDSVVLFDLRSNSGRVLWTFHNSRSTGPNLAGDAQTVRRELFAGPPFLVVDDWLWLSSSGQARLSLRKPECEWFAAPEKARTFNWPSWHTLRRLPGDRQILAADDVHIWRLTLANN